MPLGRSRPPLVNRRMKDPLAFLRSVLAHHGRLDSLSGLGQWHRAAASGRTKRPAPAPQARTGLDDDGGTTGTPCRPESFASVRVRSPNRVDAEWPACQVDSRVGSATAGSAGAPGATRRTCWPGNSTVFGWPSWQCTMSIPVYCWAYTSSRTWKKLCSRTRRRSSACRAVISHSLSPSYGRPARRPWFPWRVGPDRTPCAPPDWPSCPTRVVLVPAIVR